MVLNLVQRARGWRNVGRRDNKQMICARPLVCRALSGDGFVYGSDVGRSRIPREEFRRSELFRKSDGGGSSEGLNENVRLGRFSLPQLINSLSKCFHVFVLVSVSPSNTAIVVARSNGSLRTATAITSSRILHGVLGQ